MSIDFAALAAPFSPDVVSWRVGATNREKTKAMALAYIDARDVMERLDEVCGPENWQAIHPHANAKTSCRIGIKVGDEWVWKENGAGDSDVESEKGAFSDSLKRAAVLWGIGRYLYDVKSPWVEVEQRGKTHVIKSSEYRLLRKVLADMAEGQPRQVEPTQRATDNNPFDDGDAQPQGSETPVVRKYVEWFEKCPDLGSLAEAFRSVTSSGDIKLMDDGEKARVIAAKDSRKEQLSKKEAA